MVPFYFTDMISYQSLIVPEAVSCTVSEIQPSTCPTSLYFTTPLAFYSRRRGYPGTICIKFCTVVKLGSTDDQATKWLINIAENFNRMSMVHERYRQTDDRQNWDSKYLNVTQSRSGKKEKGKLSILFMQRLISLVVLSKRSGMDHTVLPAITPHLSYFGKRSPDSGTPE